MTTYYYIQIYIPITVGSRPAVITYRKKYVFLGFKFKISTFTFSQLSIPNEL